MATPSSPKLIPPISQNDAASPTKRPQPIPWTHQETVNLIRAYQEKWYSLKRGPLRSNQWEEVAVVVAARCGYDSAHASKSAIQCRHKMEKLRQRHRAEKHRLSGSATVARAWQYSRLMDELERGPMPISARPLMSMASFEDDEGDDDDDDGVGVDYNDCYNDDDDDDERENYIKSKSINYILSHRSSRNKYGGGLGFSRKPIWEDENNEDDYEDDNDEDDDEEGVLRGGKGLVSGLTAEMRGFAERFIGMENLKMEMMKETERCRLEMEKKRMQMILESQQRIVDSIGRAFGSSKRKKFNQQI